MRIMQVMSEATNVIAEGEVLQETTSITFTTVVTDLITALETALVNDTTFTAGDFSISGTTIDNITIEFIGDLGQRPVQQLMKPKPVG